MQEGKRNPVVEDKTQVSTSGAEDADETNIASDFVAPIADTTDKDSLPEADSDGKKLEVCNNSF